MGAVTRLRAMFLVFLLALVAFALLLLSIPAVTPIVSIDGAQYYAVQVPYPAVNSCGTNASLPLAPSGPVESRDIHGVEFHVSAYAYCPDNVSGHAVPSIIWVNATEPNGTAFAAEWDPFVFYCGTLPCDHLNPVLDLSRDGYVGAQLLYDQSAPWIGAVELLVRTS
jgi:hypothetical protein